MEVRFHLEPDSDLPHIYGHGVTEDEAEFILGHAGRGRPGRDGCQHARGQTASGRHLRVVCVPDKVGGGVFVVTGWEMRGNELRAYRRGRRR